MTKISKSLQNDIIRMTWDSLQSIENCRFYRNERGFQGALVSALNARLGESFPNGTIVEEEYPKCLERHGTNQRPDIVLHVPSECSGSGPQEGNFAVFALKRNANSADATDDFAKLKVMFRKLHYPLGFFINIASEKHHLHEYSGQYKGRIHCFTIILHDGRPLIRHVYFQGARIVEQTEQEL